MKRFRFHPCHVSAQQLGPLVLVEIRKFEAFGRRLGRKQLLRSFRDPPRGRRRVLRGDGHSPAGPGATPVP